MQMYGKTAYIAGAGAGGPRIGQAAGFLKNISYMVHGYTANRKCKKARPTGDLRFRAGVKVYLVGGLFLFPADLQGPKAGAVHLL